MTETLGQRIRRLKSEKRATFLEMATSLGVSTQTLQAWMNDKTEPAPRHIASLSQYFMVHPSYFFGADIIQSDGSLRNKSTVAANAETIFKLNDEYFVVQIPFIRQDDYQKFLSAIKMSEPLTGFSYMPFSVQSENEAQHIAFQVRGDSMFDNTYDSFKSGSVVIAKEVDKAQLKNGLPVTRWPYYLIATEEELLFRQVVAHNKTDSTISCISINPDKRKYQDQAIELASCRKIYCVVQGVRVIEL